MERTRDEVLQLLQARGECSVADLAEVIGVSPGSIRRHMDLMEAEGLVSSRLVRQPRGRPVTRYTLSEDGEERSSSAHYARLLDRLFPALASLSEEEVNGADGRDLLRHVFDRLASVRAEEHARVVDAERLEDRVAQVTEALRNEGILSESEDEGEVFRLRNVGCPYRTCAEENHAACDADRRTIELLLGMPVVQLSTMARGADCCEYLVAKEQVATEQPAPVA
jgi:DeoR family transcriptional regulator, suf operon transcriptional repressor